MNVIILRGLTAVGVLALSSSAFAQAVDESALDALDKNAPVVPVVREPAGAAELRAAMRRIALQPTDADALADAGNAALTLGDADAALNFFTRANAIRPRNGRIISGLATATVRTENPFEALRLFDEAVRLGISERSIAADRALAFDLLGNFARAQQDYQFARSAALSDDLIIRQAISLSLAGQKSEADGMLLPLLQKNNGSAWRARAFMLAARGDTRESTKVAEGFMDAPSAQKMERYLRLMPDLTAAQQAAAIHLGHFPANNIGRDSENIRRVAATIPTPAPPKNESRLIPSGEPLGKKAANAKIANERPVRRRDREVSVQTAKLPQEIKSPPPVKIAKLDKSGLATDSARAAVEGARTATVTVAKTTELPPPETARPLVDVITPSTRLPQATTASPISLSAPSVSSAPAAAVTAATNVVNAVPSVAVAQSTQPVANSPTANAVPTPSIIQGPSESGAPVALAAANVTPVLQQMPVSTNAAAPTATAAPSQLFDLAAIVGAIEIPESEQQPSVVAVDLKKLKPAPLKPAAVDAVKSGKADPKAAGKSIVAAHPARFWVQIATGEASALGYDYRKWSKKSVNLFKGQNGWTSAWGKTDRLLVGPFVDVKASKKWESDFRKAGGSGFAWKSENGVVVTALKSK